MAEKYLHELENGIEELEEQESVSHEEVVTFLENLPNEETIEFLLELGDLVGRVDGSVPHLDAILEHGEPDNEAEATLQFAAFYGLNIYHRRRKNESRLQSLHDRYGHRFSDRTMYQVSYAILLRLKGERGGLIQAIEILRKALEEITDNPGLHQSHASIITDALENGDLPEDERETYLNEAKQSINRAIRIWPDYGRYHVTKGRLLALEGRYDDARSEINRGIDLADDKQEDYPIRIGQFQQHILQADFKEYEAQLRERIESSEESLDELESDLDEMVGQLRTTMLQFLGFFTAIMAAVITTMQIATSYPPTDAIHLILSTFGGLLVAFGGLTVMIPSDDALERGVPIVLLGGLLICGALIGVYVF